MADELFESSDSARSAQPLRHLREFALPQPLPLERGSALPGVVVAYETWGTLSPAHDNVVLVCHALSGDSHAARHDDDDDPGWWDLFIGPGRCIDTDRYFVVCANVLGGCRGSTGPDSRHPQTGERYGADFPTITVGDMVNAQRHLLDHLGIDRMHAVVGGSLGGHQALAWGAMFPERTASVIALASSHRLTPQAVAFDVVGRNAILRDPGYAAGRYRDAGTNPDVGLALARMLGHITYLSQQAMSAKFEPSPDTPPPEVASEFERKFSVGSYLAHQGERFVERFDANSYMALSMAMDLFDLGADPKALRASFGNAECRFLIVSFSSDWLFPPFQSRQVVEALIPMRRDVTYCEVRSDCGHDAFLLEDDIAIYGELVRGFLAPRPELGIEGHARATRAPTALFSSDRLDYDHLLRLIEPGSSVLDLACGGGELLARLRLAGHRELMGVELSEQAIVEATRRGVPVVHADIEQGLGAFADAQFDLVVLSQTLQAVDHVEALLREMLRVGRRAIVSFPNVAFRANRQRLAEEGRVPHSALVETHRWYDPVALRQFSLLDFEELCARLGIEIERSVALDSSASREVEEDRNLEADLAIYVLASAGTPHDAGRSV